MTPKRRSVWPFGRSSKPGGQGVGTAKDAAVGSSPRWFRGRPLARSRPGAAGVALAAGSMLSVGGFPAPASASPSAATATVKSCTYAALKTAIAGGGTITFGCSGTIVFTGGQLTIGGGKTVTLDGKGKKVALASDGNGRLFQVSGGHLTLEFLTLENASVVGADGKAGGSGSTGKDGDNGTDGKDGGEGAPGTDGSDGTPGLSGGIPSAGKDAGVAQGGAIFIARGAVVSLEHAVVTHNFALGGTGGKGGTGGDGGLGGFGGAGGAGGGGKTKD